MKFWEKHAEEMRKARLLQAAAVIYASQFCEDFEEGDRMSHAVNTALSLEQEIEQHTKEKHS